MVLEHGCRAPTQVGIYRYRANGDARQGDTLLLRKLLQLLSEGVGMLSVCANQDYVAETIPQILQAFA